GGGEWAGVGAGWGGWYYASSDFSGPIRRSTEFVRLDATRIDRVIDFRDDYFPAYFLNEADFNRGIRREVTEPVTARWVGHLHPAAPAVVTIELAASGSASVRRDGEILLRASTETGPVSRTIALEPGEQVWTVEYLKPANTDPRIALRSATASGSPGDLVTPEAVRPWRRSVFGFVTVVGSLVEVVAVVLFASIVVRLIRARQWRVAAPATLVAAMFVHFVVQG